MNIQEKEGRVVQLLWTFEPQSRGLFTRSQCAERIDDGKIKTLQKAALSEQMTEGNSGLRWIFFFLPQKAKAFSIHSV